MNPLDIDCPKCRAPQGQRCKNYKGANKAPCPGRTDKARVMAEPALPVPPAPPLAAGAQLTIVNPGILCARCRLPLHGTGYLTTRKRTEEPICRDCLAGVQTGEPDLALTPAVQQERTKNPSRQSVERATSEAEYDPFACPACKSGRLDGHGHCGSCSTVVFGREPGKPWRCKPCDKWVWRAACQDCGRTSKPAAAGDPPANPAQDWCSFSADRPLATVCRDWTGEQLAEALRRFERSGSMTHDRAVIHAEMARRAQPGESTSTVTVECVPITRETFLQELPGISSVAIGNLVRANLRTLGDVLFRAGRCTGPDLRTRVCTAVTGAVGPLHALQVADCVVAANARLAAPDPDRVEPSEPPKKTRKRKGDSRG